MKLENAGTYNATLRLPANQADALITTNKGADGLKLDFVVEGRWDISETLWLSPKAYPYTVEKLQKVFGFDGDWRGFVGGKPFTNFDCSIVVEMEERDFNNKTYTNPRVKYINPRGQAATGNAREILGRLAALAGANGSDQLPDVQTHSQEGWREGEAPTGKELASMDDCPF